MWRLFGPEWNIGFDMTSMIFFGEPKFPTLDDEE